MHGVDFAVGDGAEREFFKFSCGRPQINARAGDQFFISTWCIFSELQPPVQLFSPGGEQTAFN
jgi:hypothetical protein